MLCYWNPEINLAYWQASLTCPALFLTFPFTLRHKKAIFFEFAFWHLADKSMHYWKWLIELNKPYVIISKVKISVKNAQV